MSFDEGLAERIREQFTERDDVLEKKMFGGLCFMVSGHMCCGIVNDKLMARVGPDKYETILKERYVTKMDFTGKPMKGLVYVTSDGYESEEDLEKWLQRCQNFIGTLPSR